jgi:arsenate reductase
MQARVLFIGIRNAGATVMAEGLLNHIAADDIRAESAGLEMMIPVNPLVIEVMREIGIDVSEKHPQRIFDVFRAGKAFACVVRIIDRHYFHARGPIYPMAAETYDWELTTQFSGDREEQLRGLRNLREILRERVTDLFNELRQVKSAQRQLFPAPTKH